MNRLSKYGVRDVCQTNSVACSFAELPEQAVPD